MASTSSSECGCTGSYGFGTTIPNIMGEPFFPTTRQPLIYYAKIEDPIRQQQNKRNIKEANYFMKAFRWYTQEQGLYRENEISSSKVRNGDFATWLDRKYTEYLKGSQQETSNVALKQSTTLNKDRVSKKKSAKRFGRIHSPWKKRRTKSKDSGDMSYNAASFEYIMPPKDLTKMESGCYARNSHIQSTTTIMTKESFKIPEISVKSKSLLSICETRGMCKNNETRTKSRSKNFECECLKKDTKTQYETLSLESLTTRNRLRISEIKDTDKPKKGYSRSNVSCQCSEVNLQETDAALSLRKPLLVQDRQLENKHDWGTVREVVANQGDNPKMLKTTVMFTDNSSKNISELRTLSAQTSDYPINLENVIFKQPVLLKIIHLNK